MRQRTIADVINFRESLRTFFDEVGPFLGSRGMVPPPGSRAAGEIASRPDRVEQLHTAYAQGVTLIESAADHLMATAKALDEPALTFSVWTGARGALEASAFAAWLLDPAIDADARLSRSFGRRIQGLDELRKFGDAVPDGAIAEHARLRLEEARRKAEDLGIVPATVPGPTKMIREMLREEATYRAMSAVAHGHQWALQRFGLQVGEELPDNPGLHRSEKYVNPEAILKFGSRTFGGFVKAIASRVHLHGLDIRLLRKIVDDALARFEPGEGDPARLRPVA